MDDDLLADDGQFKDDGLDDLDMDEEAALLGLSDEEDIPLIGNQHQTDEQELEYIDEEGNPVEIDENDNVELYEFADYSTDERNFVTANNQTDDDVLEVDVDVELENFSQENVETTNSETPSTSAIKDSRYEENLIPVTLISEPKDIETPGETLGIQEKESIEEVNSSIRVSEVGSGEEIYPRKIDAEEESEEENVRVEDHRERFKSERSNIITLTPAKKRTDIPDTLESVISAEEAAKVQAFLAKEQKRKMRWKGKRQGRGRGIKQIGRQSQNSISVNSQPLLQALSLPPGDKQLSMHIVPSSVPQHQKRSVQQMTPRKILINPHFRGPRSASVMEGSFQEGQINQHTEFPLPYHKQLQPRFAPPGDNPYIVGGRIPPHINVERMPSLIQPPPKLELSEQHHSSYGSHMTQGPLPQVLPTNFSEHPPPLVFPHSEHPPHPLNRTDMPPPFPGRLQMPISDIWRHPPPNVATVPPFQTNLLPAPNFREPPPLCPAASISNFPGNPPPISSYGNTNNFQIQEASVNVAIPFRPSHPPPAHQSLLPPHHPLSTFSHVPPKTNHNMHSREFPQLNQQESQNRTSQHHKFPLRGDVPHQQRHQGGRLFSQQQKNQYNQHYQIFLRKGEKRSVPNTLKSPTAKQPRLDVMQRKANIQIRTQPQQNSNIKEVPLVETLPVPQQQVTEDEDEETRELRKKIEEQKKLREQIVKRKEERRRQMAAKRMQDMKQRQTEQAKDENLVSQIQNVPNTKVKPSVQERVIAIMSHLMDTLKRDINNQARVSVKQRISLPANNQFQGQREGVVRKKIIVVRKKANSSSIVQQQQQQQPKVVSVQQRLGTRILNQKQKQMINTKQTTPKIQQASNTSHKVQKPQMQLSQAQTMTKNIAVQGGTDDKFIEALQPTSISGKVLGSHAHGQHMQRPRMPSPLLQNQRQQGKHMLGQRMNSPGFQRSHVSNIQGQRMQSPRFPNQRPQFQRLQSPRFQNQRPQGQYVQGHRIQPVGFHHQRPHGPYFQGQRAQPPALYNQMLQNQNIRPQRMQPPGFQNWRQPEYIVQGRRMPCPKFQNQNPEMNTSPEQCVPSVAFENASLRGPNITGQRMQNPRTLNQNQYMQPKQYHQAQNAGKRLLIPTRQVKVTPTAGSQQKVVQMPIPDQQEQKRTVLPPGTQPKQSGSAIVIPTCKVQPQGQNQKPPTSDSIQQKLLPIQQAVVLPKTHSVVIQNLSASTNEGQLRKLCTAVGPIENLQLQKVERKAVIKFRDASHALKFQNKYQRYMLDLSMIQVSLLPS